MYSMTFSKQCASFRAKETGIVSATLASYVVRHETFNKVNLAGPHPGHFRLLRIGMFRPFDDAGLPTEPINAEPMAQPSSRILCLQLGVYRAALRALSKRNAVLLRQVEDLEVEVTTLRAAAYTHQRPRLP
jgi:hypothetical protein